MNIVGDTALIIGSVLFLIGLMITVKKLGPLLNLGAEFERKIIHIGTGLYALLLPWIFPSRWPVYVLIFLTICVMLALRLPKMSKSGLGTTLHKVERNSYGDILLAISVGMCFFLAQENKLLYVLPIAVLTLSDAAAALVGSFYGTKRFKVEESYKSLEGSIVFFAVTLIISFVCLLLLGHFPPLNILVLSLMIAAFGTLVEAQSWRGFDNLFLPLGLLIFLAIHAENDLSQLAILFAMFFVSILGFRILAPKLGITRHAARVYVVAVFLLISVTAPHNTILPILMLIAHAFCHSVNPCKGKYPDLDVIASLALFSFGWLTLGNATGWNAISFYGITAMGITMGLATIGTSIYPLPIRLTVILSVAISLLGTKIWVAEQNPDTANWAEPLWLLSGIVLALNAIVPFVVPQIFERDRILKLTLLSITLPLGYYLFSIDFIGLFA